MTPTEMNQDNASDDGDLFSLKEITSGFQPEGLLLTDPEPHDMMDELQFYDEYSLGLMNNPLLMLMSSIMAESGQTGNLAASVTDIHALATANLISQTQEAIIQEYNIDMTSPDYFASELTHLEPVLPTETILDTGHTETHHENSDRRTLLDIVTNPMDHNKVLLHVRDSNEETVETLTTMSVDEALEQDIETLHDMSSEHSDPGQKCVQTLTTLSVDETLKQNKETLHDMTAECSDPGQKCVQTLTTLSVDETLKQNKETLHDMSAECSDPGQKCVQTLTTLSSSQLLVDRGKVQTKPYTVNNGEHLVETHDINTDTPAGENLALPSDTDMTSRSAPQRDLPEHKYNKISMCKTEVKGLQIIDKKGGQIVCEQCGKVLRNKKALQNHQTCHAPLCCPFLGCERRFNYPSHYKYHLLTHSEDRKFDCECGKVFYTSQQLLVHQRTHNLDKPYTCNQCDKSFTTAGNLKNHQRFHTGEKPFTCTVTNCDKSFAEISSLKKHLLTHSGEKPYKCSICNKGFTQTSSRIYHMKHKHSNQLDHSNSVTSSVTSPNPYEVNVT